MFTSAVQQADRLCLSRSSAGKGKSQPVMPRAGIRGKYWGAYWWKKKANSGAHVCESKETKKGNDGRKSACALRVPPGCHQPKVLSVDTFWAHLNRAVLSFM